MKISQKGRSANFGLKKSPSYLAAWRSILSFRRLRLGKPIGRLCLPAQLAAKPRKCCSQVEPGSESGRNFAYSDRLLGIKRIFRTRVERAIRISTQAQPCGWSTQKSEHRQILPPEFCRLFLPHSLIIHPQQLAVKALREISHRSIAAEIHDHLNQKINIFKVGHHHLVAQLRIAVKLHPAAAEIGR
jgi:hypothetical protein